MEEKEMGQSILQHHQYIYDEIQIYSYKNNDTNITNIFKLSPTLIQITGSLKLSGSLTISPTGSLTLPLTASGILPTGSIFFSGSFLYVWNGTRYLSGSLS